MYTFRTFAAFLFSSFLWFFASWWYNPRARSSNPRLGCRSSNKQNKQRRRMQESLLFVWCAVSIILSCLVVVPFPQAAAFSGKWIQRRSTRYDNFLIGIAVLTWALLYLIIVVDNLDHHTRSVYVTPSDDLQLGNSMFSLYRPGYFPIFPIWTRYFNPIILKRSEVAMNLCHVTCGSYQVRIWIPQGEILLFFCFLFIRKSRNIPE